MALSRQIEKHMLATYLHLRRALYLAAFALPLVLGLLGGPLKDSISAYYDDPDWRRDVFVGTLFAVGFGLISYKGFKRSEDIALNISGVMAFGTALIPHESRFVELPFRLTAHGVCAVTFFLGIIYVAVFRAEDTLALTGKRWMVTSYRVVGALIVALPGLILLTGMDNKKFWAEAAAIWIFGVFWWLKTDELQAMDRADEVANAAGAVSA